MWKTAFKYLDPFMTRLMTILWHIYDTRAFTLEINTKKNHFKYIFMIFHRFLCHWYIYCCKKAAIKNLYKVSNTTNLSKKISFFRCFKKPSLHHISWNMGLKIMGKTFLNSANPIGRPYQISRHLNFCSKFDKYFITILKQHFSAVLTLFVLMSAKIFQQ